MNRIQSDLHTRILDILAHRAFGRDLRTREGNELVVAAGYRVARGRGHVAAFAAETPITEADFDHLEAAARMATEQGTAPSTLKGEQEALLKREARANAQVDAAVKTISAALRTAGIPPTLLYSPLTSRAGRWAAANNASAQEARVRTLLEQFPVLRPSVGPALERLAAAAAELNRIVLDGEAAQTRCDVGVVLAAAARVVVEERAETIADWARSVRWPRGQMPRCFQLNAVGNRRRTSADAPSRKKARGGRTRSSAAAPTPKGTGSRPATPPVPAPSRPDDGPRRPPDED